ncbi:MAG: hypothetical protein Q8R28_01675 [Dehalococcoidia bacterium]|nr:hypothetical protein [Dehalococcoidia bacterium]
MSTEDIASVCSDTHNQPGELKEYVRYWIRRGKAGNMRLIGAGDWFDFLPLGIEQWSPVSPSVVQLMEELDGYPLHLVEGNHDPLQWLAGIFQIYPNILVSHDYQFCTHDRTYHVSHGHQYSLDWGYLGLNNFAPHLVEWMVRHHPTAWYRFCKSRNWLASLDLPGGVEHETLTPLSRIIRAGAQRSAVEHKRCEIFGHTHLSGRETIGVSSRAGFRSVWVDCGNLPDGTYCNITDDARLMFL